MQKWKAYIHWANVCWYSFDWLKSIGFQVIYYNCGLAFVARLFAPCVRIVYRIVLVDWPQKKKTGNFERNTKLGLFDSLQGHLEHCLFYLSNQTVLNIWVLFPVSFQQYKQYCLLMSTISMSNRTVYHVCLLLSSSCCIFSKHYSKSVHTHIISFKHAGLYICFNFPKQNRFKFTSRNWLLSLLSFHSEMTAVSEPSLDLSCQVLCIQPKSKKIKNKKRPINQFEHIARLFKKNAVSHILWSDWNWFAFTDQTQIVLFIDGIMKCFWKFCLFISVNIQLGPVCFDSFNLNKI